MYEMNFIIEFTVVCGLKGTVRPDGDVVLLIENSSIDMVSQIDYTIYMVSVRTKQC